MHSSVGIQTRRRWVILGVTYLCILNLAVLLQLVPATLGLLMADVGLSYAQGGLLMSLFALPGVIVSIPVGIYADRYGHGGIGMVSLVLMSVGASIFAMGNSFPILALGRMVSGVGAMTLLVIVPQLLAKWFAGREIGIAMGVFCTTVPAGTILGLNVLSVIADSLDWRVSAWFAAGLPLVALALFIMLVRPALGSRQSSLPIKGGFPSVASVGSPIWILGFAYMLLNAANMSFYTFTPEFLTGAGFSVAAAGFVTSAVMWPQLVLNPAVGYVIDRIGHKRTIIAFGSIALATLVALVPTAIDWMLPLMLLIGIALGPVPTSVLALVPDITSSQRLGLAYGILFTCFNLGIVVGPAATGLMTDVTGSYQATYGLIAGFAASITLAMLVLSRRLGRQDPPYTHAGSRRA